MILSRLKIPTISIALPLMLCYSTVCSQIPDSLSVKSTDSLSLKKPDRALKKLKDTLLTKLSYTINWDARSSIIGEQRVNIWGVNTGIILGKKRHQLTVGYYWMNFNSYLRLLDLRRKAAKRVNIDYYTKTDLYFFSLMYWPNLINNKRWRISIPIEVGIGTTKNQGVGLLDEIQIWKRKDYFLPVQAGLFIGWKATRWGGLNIQGGYRYALHQQNIAQSYNGLYYSFGINTQLVILSDLYKWVFKHQKPTNVLN